MADARLARDSLRGWCGRLFLAGLVLLCASASASEPEAAPPTHPRLVTYERTHQWTLWFLGTPGTAFYSRLAMLTLDDETWQDALLAAVAAQNPDLLPSCDDGLPPWPALRGFAVDDAGTLTVAVVPEMVCSDEADRSMHNVEPDALPITGCVPRGAGALECTKDTTGASVVASFRQRQWWNLETKACATNGVCPFSFVAWYQGQDQHRKVVDLVLDCEATPEVCAHELTAFVSHTRSSLEGKRLCKLHPSLCPPPRFPSPTSSDCDSDEDAAP